MHAKRADKFRIFRHIEEFSLRQATMLRMAPMRNRFKARGRGLAAQRLAQLIVQTNYGSKDAITINATAAGLQAASVTIPVKQVAAIPYVEPADAPLTFVRSWRIAPANEGGETELREKSFKTAEAAAKFFVDKRHSQKLGGDYAELDDVMEDEENFSCCEVNELYDNCVKVRLYFPVDETVISV